MQGILSILKKEKTGKKNVLAKKPMEEGTEKSAPVASMTISQDSPDLSFEHQAFEAMNRIYSKIENEEDPTNAILIILREIKDFYQADWAGIVFLDLPIQVWCPYMWISERTGEMGPTRIQPFEYSESFNHWVECFQQRKPLIVLDREKIKETDPDEYENYLRLDATAVMGYPFDKKQKGFLLIRNQKRFAERAEMLKHCCPIIIAAMNERALLQQTKELPQPTLFDPEFAPEEQEVTAADIIVGMFGDPRVKMKKGIISFPKERSPIAWRLFANMVLNRENFVSRESMIDAICRDDRITNPERSLRDHVYNLRSFFRDISDDEVIENIRGMGYRINRQLSIITDYEVFDRYIEYAAQAATNFSRIQCLETAVKLYKGRFFEKEHEDANITNLATHYHVKYLAIMEDLLRSLFETGDYEKVQKYAGNALKQEPGKMEFYYWLILSLKKSNLDRHAEAIGLQAQRNLEEDEYQGLTRSLRLQIR